MPRDHGTMARASLPFAPRKASPLIDLGTAARRRQAAAAPQPQPMEQPYAGPGLPQLQTPTQTAPAGSLTDGTVQMYGNGGRLLVKPRAMQSGPAVKEIGPRDQVLDEPVAGVGMYSGKIHFVAGEKGPERIAIGKQPGGPPQVSGTGPGVRWFAVGGDVDAGDEGADLNAYTGGNGGTQTLTYDNYVPATQQVAPPAVVGAPGYPDPNAQQPQQVTTNPTVPYGGPGYGQGQGQGSGNLSYPGSVIGQVGPGSTGATEANQQQFQATQAAFSAKAAAQAAQLGVLPAQAAQTSAQSAYYQEQAAAAQRELALEQQRQAAQQDVGNLTATAERANEQANQDYKFGIAGVAKPQDIVLPPGYSGPALPEGVRPAIETNEQVIQRQLTNLQNVNQLQGKQLSAQAEEAGIPVARAQQQAQAADIGAQQAALAESISKSAPSPGLQWDELVGQWVTPMEYAQSHALNRYVTDPVNKVRVTYEELAQRTDAHGNILNLQTNQWQSPAPAGQEGNTFQDTSALGYPGDHWVDLDHPSNVFVDGKWIDTATGNFWVQTGENSGEWHTNRNGREYRLTASGWTPVKGGGGNFAGGLDASGNPIGDTGAAGGVGDSGLSPNQ